MDCTTTPLSQVEQVETSRKLSISSSTYNDMPLGNNDRRNNLFNVNDLNTKESANDKPFIPIESADQRNNESKKIQHSYKVINDINEKYVTYSSGVVMIFSLEGGGGASTRTF